MTIKRDREFSEMMSKLCLFYSPSEDEVRRMVEEHMKPEREAVERMLETLDYFLSFNDKDRGYESGRYAIRSYCALMTEDATRPNQTIER